MQLMAEHYQAYLLRLKRTQSNGRWRTMLQNVQTGEIRHFATEEDMVHYLLQTLADSTPKAQSAARAGEPFNSTGAEETASNSGQG